jgi:aryl-alcohol dehydrogenase-like predicted oxidoreductase
MLALSDANGWARFVTMQNHYNLLYREEEREMNPLCRSEDVGLIPWSPLARGVLARKRKEQTTRTRTDDFGKKLYSATEEADGKILDALEKISTARGIPQAQIALAWLLQQKGLVAPIVGASKPQHLEDALASLSVKLSAEETKQLTEPYVPHPIAGHD